MLLRNECIYFLFMSVVPPFSVLVKELKFGLLKLVSILSDKPAVIAVRLAEDTGREVSWVAVANEKSLWR